MMLNLTRKVKQPKKDEDEHDETKKPKKGKAVKRGGTVGMGRIHEDEDSGDPELDIEEGRMKPKSIKRPKMDTASQEQGGGGKDVHLPKTYRCPDCRCWSRSGGHHRLPAPGTSQGQEA